MATSIRFSMSLALGPRSCIGLAALLITRVGAFDFSRRVCEAHKMRSVWRVPCYASCLYTAAPLALLQGALQRAAQEEAAAFVKVNNAQEPMGQYPFQ
jgi:hypothetical protein